MAEGKKSFVLYCDLIHTVEKMPVEKAGQLFIHILKYVNDQNPETDDILIQIAFEPIKQQLKRDLKHWEDICLIRSESGKKGGRPKKQTKAKKANGFFKKQTKAKKADNDNVNDNDTVIDNGKEKKKYIDNSELNLLFIDFLEMRKKIKKPATERAIELLISDLKKLSSNENNQKLIIEQSLKNCWQGFFPLKKEQGEYMVQ